MKGNGHYEGQSKGGILAKACEYIMELKEHQQKIEVLQQQNFTLERENYALKEFIKKNGLEVPKEIGS